MNELNEKKSISKFIIFLFSLYMCSILVFSSKPELNIYSRWLFVICFGCMVMLLIFKRIHIKFNSYIFLLFIFFLICRFSEAWAIDSPLVLSQTGTIFQLFLLSAILFYYAFYVEDTESFIIALLISGIIGGIYIFLYYGIDGYIKLLSKGERIGTEINNVNSIGVYMTFSVIIGFFYGYIKKKKLGYLAMLLPFLLSMGSGSRKALFGMAAGIFLVIILEYRRKTSLKSLIKLMISIVLAIALLYWLSTLPIFATIFKRFAKMLGIEGFGKIDSSTTTRINMIKVGWEYFLEHPLTGCGIGNSRYIVAEALGRFTYLHNNFIELLASIGIFGFISYYLIYVYLLWNLYKIFIKNNNTQALILFVILAVQLMLDIGMVSYYSKITYVYLTLGAVEIPIKREKDIDAVLEKYRQDIDTVIK